MMRILSAFAVAAVAAFGAAAPAAAAGPAGIAGPSIVGEARASAADMVQTVDHRRYHRRHHDRRWDRHHRPRHHYRGGTSFSFHFGSPGYYYAPQYRVAPRYRAAPRSHYRVSNAHVRWCESRYRSYRAWDNTWQPYHGGRRQCWSPYS